LRPSRRSEERSSEDSRTRTGISYKGPGSDIASSYARLEEFIRNKGRKAVGPPVEAYSKGPGGDDGRTIIYAKIMMPVG